MSSSTTPTQPMPSLPRRYNLRSAGLKDATNDDDDDDDDDDGLYRTAKEPPTSTESTVTLSMLSVKHDRKRVASSSITKMPPSPPSSGAFVHPLSQQQVAFCKTWLEKNTKGRSRKSGLVRCFLCQSKKLNLHGSMPPWSCYATNIDSDVDRNLQEICRVRCCRKDVCLTCLTTCIWKDIQENRWQWLLWQYPTVPCNINTACSQPISLQYLIETLRTCINLGLGAAEVPLAEAIRIRDMRNAVHHSQPYPYPSPTTCQLSVTIHTKLEANMLLKKNNVDTLTMFGTIEKFPDDDIIVRFLETHDNNAGKTVQVPLITSLFNTEAYSSVRDCVVCTETYTHVGDTASLPAAWQSIMAEHPGDWKRLLFPLAEPDELATCEATHQRDICRSCIETHLTTRIEGASAASIDDLLLDCPSSSCGHVFTEQQLQGLLPAGPRDRLDNLRLIKQLSSLPDFRWCLARECGAGQLVSLQHEEDEETPFFCCVECGFEMCFKHQAAWHEGFTCSGFDAAEKRKVENEARANNNWLQQNSQICPNTACGVRIEKNGGCQHMTCRSCRYEFCWYCRGHWLYHGYFGCRYYP